MLRLIALAGVVAPCSATRFVAPVPVIMDGTPMCVRCPSCDGCPQATREPIEESCWPPAGLRFCASERDCGRDEVCNGCTPSSCSCETPRVCTRDCRFTCKPRPSAPPTATRAPVCNPICCQAVIASCEACKRCQSVEDYCAANPRTQGCTAPTPEPTAEVDVCTLPKETGRCRAAFRKWFYNAASNECEQFTYGGCGGNANRYDTKADCLASGCVVDKCDLPAVTGPCKALFRSWFYNSDTNACEQFTYGGCQGNANRYASEQECMASGCVAGSFWAGCEKPRLRRNERPQGCNKKGLCQGVEAVEQCRALKAGNCGRGADCLHAIFRGYRNTCQLCKDAREVREHRNSEIVALAAAQESEAGAKQGPNTALIASIASIAGAIAGAAAGACIFIARRRSTEPQVEQPAGYSKAPEADV